MMAPVLQVNTLQNRELFAPALDLIGGLPEP